MLKTRSRALVALAGLALVGAPALAGCSDEDSTAAASGDRPVVTFTATDTELIVPAEVPSGFVDIDLQTEPGDVDVHHIFVARLHDGVTVDEVLNSDDENGDDDAFFTKLTLKGGNGSIATGEDVTMTLDLEPGNYFALDNPQNENSPSAAFTVVDSGDPGRRREAEGVITMGPGMVIDVPEDFDGTGTWEFVNEDSEEVHEAALVKLTPGATSDDLVEWFGGDHQTPPPIDGEFGSMGALGPGQRAWITIEPGEPGEYVLVCFVPGRDGIPHVMKGMVTPVTVG
jgi:hypothetical protein